MWPVIGGLLGGASSLIGSIFSANQSAANTQAQIGAQANMLDWSSTFNKEEADRARSFSAEQAAVSRDFSADQANQQRAYQTQMSNTAFQRASADMKAAGLNPMIMAGGGGGASTPSGAMGVAPMPSAPAASVGTPGVPMPQTQSKMAGIGNAINNAISSAINVKTYDKMTEEIANIQADSALRSAQTGVARQAQATEVERTKKTGAEADTATLGLPGARFSAKQAEDLLSMPAWLRSSLTIGGFGGTGISKTIEPLTDLISGAGAVRRLMPSRSTVDRTDSSGNSTFEDRWSNLWR